ncbi:hypothetical protein KFL_005690030 [Klebsormidium nitens]|uniref:Uncharacterized protein n=1 Tax=Klebsormidium nitens TaxID=105231 RepID=A0A1Y1IP06_KLENI|nr:hypothetical protein KFL_005690030 [Klebsormidium nitens]|eukprot:GAQ89848.1 hypothetical protein KFL_005690030 [Klebsormidium nitens]
MPLISSPEWGDMPFEATPEEMKQPLSELMAEGEESALQRAAGMAAWPGVLGTASPTGGEQAQLKKGKERWGRKKGSPTPLGASPDLPTLTGLALHLKGLSEQQVADQFAQHREAHRLAAPPRVKILSGQQLSYQFLASNIPGLNQIVNEGPRTLRISKGNPMARITGLTQGG